MDLFSGLFCGISLSFPPQNSFSTRIDCFVQWRMMMTVLTSDNTSTSSRQSPKVRCNVRSRTFMVSCAGPPPASRPPPPGHEVPPNAIQKLIAMNDSGACLPSQSRLPHICVSSLSDRLVCRCRSRSWRRPACRPHRHLITRSSHDGQQVHGRVAYQVRTSCTRLFALTCR